MFYDTIENGKTLGQTFWLITLIASRSRSCGPPIPSLDSFIAHHDYTVADPTYPTGYIQRTRRTPPPPYCENIAVSCIFWNKVKLTILFQPKCGLRPLLLHILDPPLL